MSAERYNRDALFSADGLVVVITGGGSGLGQYIAHALDANGAKAVYILGRRQNSLDETVKGAKNGSIKPIVADVTDKDSLQRAVDQVKSEVGYVNVVFANSGITGPLASELFSNGKKPSVEELQSFLWKTPMDEFTNTFHVNITGTFYTYTAFLGLLDEGNKRRTIPQTSQVIVTSSVAAFSRVPAAGFSYSASKVALNHLVKQLSTTGAHLKIRANAIAPGLYPSEMTANFPWNTKDQDPREEGAIPSSVVPLERTGSEEDIAGLALFLVSRAGAYTNGSIQLTDGGRVAVFPSGY